jgi:hypothetical protein
LFEKFSPLLGFISGFGSKSSSFSPLPPSSSSLLPPVVIGKKIPALQKQQKQQKQLQQSQPRLDALPALRFLAELQIIGKLQ